MTEFKDEQLVAKIKQNPEESSDYIKELSSRHAKMFSSFSTRYNSSFRESGVDVQSVLNKESIVFDCANSYNPEKNTKFSTWLYNNIRFTCLNSLSEKHLVFETGCLDNLNPKLLLSQEKPDMGESKEIAGLLFDYVSKLGDNRAKFIIQQRYFEGEKQTWDKIAQKLDLSEQQVINIHTKTLKTLQYKLQSKIN